MRPRLDDARAQIDAIDAEILDLLARRAAIVAALWAEKVAANVPLRDPAREAAMLEALRAAARQRGLDPDRIAAVFEAVIGHPLQAEAELSRRP